MTLAEILKEGERLEREATKGPWVGNVHGEVRAVPLDRLSIGFFSRSYSAGVNGSHEVTADDAEANATFAAFARTALPRLLAVARAGRTLAAAVAGTGSCTEELAAFDAAVRGEGKETTDA